MAEMKIPVSIVGDGLVVLRRKDYDEMSRMQRVAVMKICDAHKVEAIRQKAKCIQTSPEAWDVPDLAKEIVQKCNEMLKALEEPWLA